MPRELLDTGTDKRFIRRDGGGRFGETDDVGRSLTQDRRQKAKRVIKAGDGDRGDQKPRAAKASPSAAKRKSPAKGRTAATARQRAKSPSAKRTAKSAAAHR
jgi:hypothetical protein